jgi:hypothetical protein
MTQLILRVINVIEVLSIYYAIKHQRQGDRNATEQQQHQANTCQPAQHPQQPEEQSQPTTTDR